VSFDTAAVLSWALPLAVLLAVCVWWFVAFRRGAGR
jgi:cytochrome c-type biogenesis protein CcmH/NrfF